MQRALRRGSLPGSAPPGPAPHSAAQRAAQGRRAPGGGAAGEGAGSSERVWRPALPCARRHVNATKETNYSPEDIKKNIGNRLGTVFEMCALPRCLGPACALPGGGRVGGPCQRCDWVRLGLQEDRSGQGSGRAPPPMPVLHLRVTQQAPARAAAGCCRFTGKGGEDRIGLMLATGPRKQVGRACWFGPPARCRSWPGRGLAVPRHAHTLRTVGWRRRIQRRPALLFSAFSPAPLGIRKWERVVLPPFAEGGTWRLLIFQ